MTEGLLDRKIVIRMVANAMYDFRLLILSSASEEEGRADPSTEPHRPFLRSMISRSF